MKLASDYRISAVQIALLVAVFFLVGSFSPCPALGDKIRASVSIPPLKYMLNKIGGERVQVSVMVSPGANPATYEPKPRQMSSLADTDLYFAVGVPFEKSWLPRFSRVNKEMRIIHLDKEVNKRELATGYRHVFRKEAKDTEGNDDPHVWLSPLLMRIMAEKTMRTLCTHDPENTSTYRKNFLQFSREVNRLDKHILTLFSQGDADRDKFMTLHPAWGYLARDYGLQQIPMKLQGKTPGPKQMGQLIRLGEKLEIDKIFVQPQFSSKKAKAIAEQIGARVVGLDPLAEDWSSNLLQMAEKIRAGLRK